MRPPPGYPFVGPLESRPPPPVGAGPARDQPSSVAAQAGVVGFLVGFSALMMGLGFLMVAFVAADARHSPRLGGSRSDSAEMAQMTQAPPRSLRLDDEGAEVTDPSSRVVDAPLALAPPVARHVPVHPDRFLEGCSATDLDAVADAMRASVSRSASFFNDGDLVGCVADYERTTKDVESSVPATCQGPAKALASGRSRANDAETDTGKAWAYRDAFDGLVEAIERSRAGGVGNL
jgi:hypothetical protein